MSKALGLVLWEWRRQRNLTQKELAGKTGISVASLGAYERGVRDPGLEARARICVALDLEAQTFCREVAQGEAREMRELMKELGIGTGLADPALEKRLEKLSHSWDVVTGRLKEAFLQAAEQGFPEDMLQIAAFKLDR